MKKKTAAIYVRMSTLHQHDIQQKDLVEYCQRRGWNYVLYLDKGQSGKKETRPALDRMMKDAASKKFDLVCVWRCDRFSRSVRHFVNSIYYLEQLGVGFISVSESIDLSSDNPLTKVVMLLISSLAELEHSILLERQSAGIQRAKENGVQFGRPRVGFDIRKALVLRNEQGYSLRQLARELKISVSTLSRNLPKSA